MVASIYPYVVLKCLNGDKSDNINSLLSPKKAIDTITDQNKFDKFLSIEENRVNFNINKTLIEFFNVPLEEIVITDGIVNFNSIREEFDKMNVNSITNDKSCKKYVETFNCLKC